MFSEQLIHQLGIAFERECLHAVGFKTDIRKVSVDPYSHAYGAEYIGGKTGQTKQAESGFAIPSQKDIAKSEVFLQSSQSPQNSIIFVRAAEIQTPGDWWYLRDKAWIDDWAGVLNGDVRNGKKTLSAFEDDSKYKGTWDKLKAYTKK